MANDPSRQQEAANHGDAEFPGQSSFSSTRPGTVDFDVFDQRKGALQDKLEERPKRSLQKSSCCEGFSCLITPKTTFPTFHLDTPDDGVVVQKPPVWTSAPAAARFRRWTHCPPLCQRPGLELAQLRVPAPRDPWTPLHSPDKTPPLASGGGARVRAIRGTPKDVSGTSCVTSFCTITSCRHLHLRPIQKMRSIQARRSVTTRQRIGGAMRDIPESPI